MEHDVNCGRKCEKCKLFTIILVVGMLFFLLGALLITIGDETFYSQTVTTDLLDDYCSLSYGEVYEFKDVVFGLNDEIGCTNGIILKYIK